MIAATVALGACSSGGGGGGALSGSPGDGDQSTADLCFFDTDQLRDGGRLSLLESAEPTTIDGEVVCEYIGAPSVRQLGAPESVAVLRVARTDDGAAAFEEARSAFPNKSGTGEFQDLEYVATDDAVLVLDAEDRLWTITRLSYRADDGTIEDASTLTPTEEHAEALAEAIGWKFSS